MRLQDLYGTLIAEYEPAAWTITVQPVTPEPAP